MNSDIESEIFFEHFTLVCNSNEMLTNRVEVSLHLEIITSNAKIISLIKKFKDFIRFNRFSDDVFVDLRDLTFIHKLHFLQLAEEDLQLAHALFLLQFLLLYLNDS